MKALEKIAVIWFLLISCNTLAAQKIDSIYFHLYTDSLKKGVYNYINVDGLSPNGRYIPLSSRQIEFSANTGHWDGNSLVIDSAYTKDSVVIKAVLKENPSLQKTVVIYLKKLPDNELLKTKEEILHEISQPKKKKPGG